MSFDPNWASRDEAERACILSNYALLAIIAKYLLSKEVMPPSVAGLILECVDVIKRVEDITRAEDIERRANLN